MTLTHKQKNDIECARYFIPVGQTDFSAYEKQQFIDNGEKRYAYVSGGDKPKVIMLREITGTQSAEDAYLEVSETGGINKYLKNGQPMVDGFGRYIKLIETRDLFGLYLLLAGKRWRGIHIEMYESGILDGSMPYIVILGKAPYDDGKPVPRAVVDFLKKEMFKGQDADLIEAVYTDRPLYEIHTK